MQEDSGRHAFQIERFLRGAKIIFRNDLDRHGANDLDPVQVGVGQAAFSPAPLLIRRLHDLGVAKNPRIRESVVKVNDENPLHVAELGRRYAERGHAMIFHRVFQILNDLLISLRVERLTDHLKALIRPFDDRENAHLFASSKSTSA